MPAGKLILLPNVLEESLSIEPFLPPSVKEAVSKLKGLIAESEKSARRYLRKFISHDHMQTLPLRLLNEHTPLKDLEELLAPMLNGEIWGLVSDAGLPCIADPGAELVALARFKGIAIDALVGPCSLILALQLSGFSGQRFCFHGYLPREEGALGQTIRELEKRSHGETQIWIEAPYRSVKMLEFLKRMLHSNTQLSIAVGLTTPAERVASYKIDQWKSVSFPLGKEPAVFLIFSDNL
jgi:16S rRNA (cytidine1402-2'-O)-methyltransferase